MVNRKVANSEYDYSYEDCDYEYELARFCEENADRNLIKFRPYYPLFRPYEIINAVKKLREQELREREDELREREENEKKRLENEENEKKRLENERLREIDSDSDSEIEEVITVKPLVEKFDPSFPSIGQAIIMMKDNSEGWQTIPAKKTKPVVEVVKKTGSDLNKTRMCDSVSKKFKCRHHNCRFAHSTEELVLLPCQYGKDCNRVCFNKTYYSNSGDKVCDRHHPDENVEDYYIRVGLKKRGPPTEEEMQEIFDEFLADVKQVKQAPKPHKKNVWKKFENVQFKKPVEIKQKPVKLAAPDFEQQKIRDKNETVNRISQIKSSIVRNDDTISRFKSLKGKTEYHLAQIEKLQQSNDAFKNELTSLDEKIKSIDTRQKPVQVKVEIPVQVEVKPKAVEVAVVKKVKEEVKIYLYMPQCVVKVQSPVVSPKVEVIPKEKPSADDGWIEVKSNKPLQTPVIPIGDRNTAFDILKDKSKLEKVLTKTKMCSFGKNCQRGKNCRFAHSKRELTVRTCIFGNDCKFVKRTANGFVNVSKTKCCEFKHPDEMINNFYSRVGI